MRVLRTKEYEAIPDLEVTDHVDLRRDVLKQGFVTVRTARDDNSEQAAYSRIIRRAYAGGLVGLVPLTRDTAILVEPRFPANLTHMVTAVGVNPTPVDIARDFATTEVGEASDWMLRRLCGEFLDATERVLTQGLYRTYKRRTEATSSPKGRIMVTKTITKHAARNVPYRAEVAYHLRTEANPPNQALLEAAHWVQGYLPSLTGHDVRSLRKRNEAVLHSLRFIERDPLGHFRNDPHVLDPRTMPLTRTAYRTALPIAVALLDRRGFTLDAGDGDLSLSSLLVKTDEVFETFVRRRLQEHLPTLTVLDGNNLKPQRRLFQKVPDSHVPSRATNLAPGSNTIAPDILVEDDHGRSVLVADVKYVPIGAAEGGHAERRVIEQIITYAYHLGCKAAVSIHPARADQKPGLYISGTIGLSTVYVYLVNLGANDLDAEMEKMAQALEAIVT